MCQVLLYTIILNLYGQFKAEQDTLNGEIYKLTKKLGEQKDVCTGVNRFLKIIKGYATDREAIHSLSREDLLKLIDCIVVKEKQKGDDTQHRIEIRYQYVDNIENLLPRDN